MKIALIGTRGVPAAYGGFETAVEEVGQRLAQRGHEVVVYCRSDPGSSSHLGMRRVYKASIRLNAFETLSHAVLSALHCLRDRPDAAVVFNAANVPAALLLRLRSIPHVVHVDGMESRRDKWGHIGRCYYRLMERAASRLSAPIVADAEAIADFYSEQFHRSSEVIAYGAPVFSDLSDDRLHELDLRSRGYHLVVARLEPENNVDMILRGYRASRCQLPLVVVGAISYGVRYGLELEAFAAADDRVRLVGAIYDQELLNQLYFHSAVYVHGHSVGGTNPSLLRAMGAGAVVLAHDNVFNREVLGDIGQFFSDEAIVRRWLAALEPQAELLDDERKAAAARVESRYSWDDVADKYERLLQSVARERRPTFVRTPSDT